MVVLGGPPGVAHAEEEVAKAEVSDLICAAAMERLPVCDIMREQTLLGADEAKEDGVEEEEPRVVDDQRDYDASGEHAEDGDDFAGVVPGLRLEQPGFAHAALEFAILRCLSPF